MKQTFCRVVFMFCFAPLWAQPCTPDESILNGEELFLPEFWSPGNQVFNFAPACVNQPYGQTLTIHIPASLLVPGLGEVAVNNFSIASAGGIVNLPSGMAYSCNPPSCVFEPETLGCIQLEGTPNTSNSAPDTLALSMLGVLDIGFPIALTVPGGLEPGSMWPLILRTEEECINAVEDQTTFLPDIRVYPNPFQTETTLMLTATAPSTFNLSICDVSGRIRQREGLRLDQGLNEVTFKTWDLPAGIYFLQLTDGMYVKNTRITIIP